jgi:hypothetical protein
MLPSLPPELVLCVADFLPLEDVYCLSLCNHRLLEVLKRMTNCVKMNRDSRLSFLRRLEHDHPRYFVCYYCCALQECRVDSPQLVGLILLDFRCGYPLKQPPSRALSVLDSMHLMLHHSRTVYTNYIFHFAHLNLAMRQFYYGPQYGISTNSLSFTEVRCHRPFGPQCLGSTVLLSVDTQICPEPPSFYMRVQDIMLVKDIGVFLPTPKVKAEPNPHVFFRICAHTPLSIHIEQIASARCGVMDYSRFADWPCHLSRTCKKCNTDFMLELYTDPRDLVTLLITRWICLGPGRRPDDPLWMVHSRAEKPGGLVLGHMGPSPRRIFEQLTDTPFMDLSLRNRAYLVDEVYRAMMVPMRGAIPAWGWWPGAPVIGNPIGNAVDVAAGDAADDVEDEYTVEDEYAVEDAGPSLG